MANKKGKNGINLNLIAKLLGPAILIIVIIFVLTQLGSNPDPSSEAPVALSQTDTPVVQEENVSTSLPPPTSEPQQENQPTPLPPPTSEPQQENQPTPLPPPTSEPQQAGPPSLETAEVAERDIGRHTTNPVPYTVAQMVDGGLSKLLVESAQTEENMLMITVLYECGKPDSSCDLTTQDFSIATNEGRRLNARREEFGSEQLGGGTPRARYTVSFATSYTSDMVLQFGRIGRLVYFEIPQP